ncbi:MAG: LLM class F420-dependent oxidoreductase [Acidimicrobiia bacterium]|nr:LLM class F420-dependent oxidoreductase [Acidimicrobiia bacterium]MYE71692.1 LLM class F420-dependent oxidoreductase [Acidimicrobiia bacterium]MYH96525.1 LLM class F420-dependent oxidoreductase [Acidimicrobiia bacterium]MYJ61019.1 LLM class F420-dependent oxidoreductase [Acidimicrobiia bacterium]
MKFGLYLIGTATGAPGLPAAPIADPEFLAGFARHAEAVGCDSLFFADHIVFPAAKQAPYPYAESGAYPWDNENTQLPEPLALMAFLAGVTDTLRFGTAVLVLPQRHPMLLAKQLATIDVLSGGRAELGIGAGWLADEFDALGYSFADRGPRTDEYIDVMRELWTNPVASFAGPTIAFDRIQLTTHPRQPGGVPIIVGGHSPPALRRAGQRGDSFLPAFSASQNRDTWPEMWAEVKRWAADEGRDGACDLQGFGASLDDARFLADLGATRMIYSTHDPDLASAMVTLNRFADEVISRF